MISDKAIREVEALSDEREKERQAKERPPLGLTPKCIHEATRAVDISLAISRYLKHQMKIPMEWVEEYNQLISKNTDG